MKGCPRCHSLVVHERFVDRDSELHGSRFWGWRSVICGGIFDPLILVHQATRPEPRRYHMRVKKSTLLVWLAKTAEPAALGRNAEES